MLDHIFTEEEILDALHCSKQGKTSIYSELEYIATNAVAPEIEEGGYYA